VRAEDGTFRARRGSGGLAGTLGRLLSGGTDEPVGWVAAAMTDDDRAAAADGATALPDIGLELLALDPRQHRLHYDILSNAPFCGPNSIRVRPDEVGRAICGSMATVPCGFHSRRWARAYEACVEVVLGDDSPRAATFAAPLGPDPADLTDAIDSSEGRSALETLEKYLGDRLLLLRSNRVEPSKNIVRGFLAFDLLLERAPEWRERVVFVAMLNESR